jgi:hypothetical protein
MRRDWAVKATCTVVVGASSLPIQKKGLPAAPKPADAEPLSVANMVEH